MNDFFNMPENIEKLKAIREFAQKKSVKVLILFWGGFLIACVIYSFFQSKIEAMMIKFPAWFWLGNAFFALCFLLKAYFWFSDYFRERERLQKERETLQELKKKKDEMCSALRLLSDEALYRLKEIAAECQRSPDAPYAYISSKDTLAKVLCEKGYIKEEENIQQRFYTDTSDPYHAYSVPQIVIDVLETI